MALSSGRWWTRQAGQQGFVMAARRYSGYDVANRKSRDSGVKTGAPSGVITSQRRPKIGPPGVLAVDAHRMGTPV